MEMQATSSPIAIGQPMRAKKRKLKVLWFSFEGIGFHIAKRLMDEGNEVLVGQVESYADLNIEKDEDPKDTKKRLSTFDGIIEKIEANALLKQADKFEDKDEWSVICDFNNLWHIADQLKEMGFGGENCTGFIFLPTKEQCELEGDRNAGKEFVKEHYTGVEVGEEHQFAKVDDAVKFLTDNAAGGDKIFVLKANSDDLNALVPRTNDPNLAKDALISALISERAGYESQGFILEEKITDPLELTPQVVFYDGIPIFYDLDIENKPIGAGNNGPQTGCAMNLVTQISQYDQISQLAFPPVVYDMAMGHKGMFVFDASILIDGRTGKLYFGEFCANRWGWDALFTELAMCSSVTDYFTKIMMGVNPMTQQFGAAVRMFNVKKEEDKQVLYKSLDSVWLYDVWQKGKKLLSIGYSWDLCVLTGSGTNLESAVDHCYDAVLQIESDGGVVRPKFDFMSLDYPTSILNRYNEGLAKNLYYGTKYEGVSVDEKVTQLEREVARAKADAETERIKFSGQLQEIKEQLIDALQDEEE